jgi:hypothetical protein
MTTLERIGKTLDEFFLAPMVIFGGAIWLWRSFHASCWPLSSVKGQSSKKLPAAFTPDVSILACFASSRTVLSRPPEVLLVCVATAIEPA